MLYSSYLLTYTFLCPMNFLIFLFHFFSLNLFPSFNRKSLFRYLSHMVILKLCFLFDCQWDSYPISIICLILSIPAFTKKICIYSYRLMRRLKKRTSVSNITESFYNGCRGLRHQVKLDGGPLSESQIVYRTINSTTKD